MLYNEAVENKVTMHGKKLVVIFCVRLLVERVRWPMPAYLNALHALSMYWAVYLALGADTTLVAACSFRFVIYAVGGPRAQAGRDAHSLGTVANGAQRQDH